MSNVPMPMPGAAVQNTFWVIQKVPQQIAGRLLSWGSCVGWLRRVSEGNWERRSLCGTTCTIFVKIELVRQHFQIMNKLKEDLINCCKLNNRVCPQPQLWTKMYEMLPNRKQIGAGWVPPLPLILTAWWDTSEAEKQSRLFQHLDWAENNNSLEAVSKFLHSLPENGWFHFGD